MEETERLKDRVHESGFALRYVLVWILAFFCVAWPCKAQAHTGLAAVGFMSGLLHPVYGLDHFLAMLSVGIISAQIGGIRIYTIPALFVFSMVVGAAIGWHGHPWPFADPGIALSVVVLGLGIVVVEKDKSLILVMAVVAFFGCLHGHAHGLEMPYAADPVYYAAGFVTSTAMIHLLGVAIGYWLMKGPRLRFVLRHMGSLMAGMGAMIFFQSLK